MKARFSSAIRSLSLALVLGSGLLSLARAGEARISIQADKPGVAVSPLLYGIFFEEINRAGDGGLYAEMLQNRSFEDFNLPMGWTLLTTGESHVTMSLDASQPLNAKNPTSLRLDITSLGSGERAGIINQGFKGVTLHSKDSVVLPTDDSAGSGREELRKWIAQYQDALKQPVNGLNIVSGKTYNLSLYARTDAAFSGSLTVSLEKQDGTILASQDIPNPGTAWKKITAALTPTTGEGNARFVLSAQTTGTVWLDMVSLFPAETFHNRPNGFRADLMQMLVDLHPAFVRFPGGSFGEGHTLADAYRWKETIGDLAQRPGHWNIWGYHSSDGLGYLEYLQMCEDLKAEPLFVINCGMAEQGFVPPDQLDPWIQDALDSLEYANGSPDSTWGSVRVQNGHPEPFHLKLMEIGNENGMGYWWGGGSAQDYQQRYLPFYQKIKAAHPEVTTIATAPIQKPPLLAPMEILDEHYYPTADWFEEHATMYDRYDRKGPKIYVGEYATKPGAGTGNQGAALGEAAFMTGMERNSDVVVMSSYAPLFVNPNWLQWNPNAIVFDSSRVYGTPSYYTQLLFANNRPDVILPVTLETPPTAVNAGEKDAKSLNALYAVAGSKNDTGEMIVKVVNIGADPQTTTIALNGAVPASFTGTAIVLASDKPQDENSFTAPTKIAPKQSDLGTLTTSFSYTFAPYSITVLRLKPSS